MNRDLRDYAQATWQQAKEDKSFPARRHGSYLCRDSKGDLYVTGEASRRQLDVQGDLLAVDEREQHETTPATRYQAPVFQ